MESGCKPKNHSGHESHNGYVCHQCGYVFPNPHPSPKHRKAHKKRCTKNEGLLEENQKVLNPKIEGVKVDLSEEQNIGEKADEINVIETSITDAERTGRDTNMSDFKDTTISLNSTISVKEDVLVLHEKNMVKNDILESSIAKVSTTPLDCDAIVIDSEEPKSTIYCTEKEKTDELEKGMPPNECIEDKAGELGQESSRDESPSDQISLCTNNEIAMVSVTFVDTLVPLEDRPSDSSPYSMDNCLNVGKQFQSSAIEEKEHVENYSNINPEYYPDNQPEASCLISSTLDQTNEELTGECGSQLPTNIGSTKIDKQHSMDESHNDQSIEQSHFGFGGEPFEDCLTGMTNVGELHGYMKKEITKDPEIAKESETENTNLNLNLRPGLASESDINNDSNQIVDRDEIHVDGSTGGDRVMESDHSNLVLGPDYKQEDLHSVQNKTNSIHSETFSSEKIGALALEKNKHALSPANTNYFDSHKYVSVDQEISGHDDLEASKEKRLLSNEELMRGSIENLHVTETSASTEYVIYPPLNEKGGKIQVVKEIISEGLACCDGVGISTVASNTLTSDEPKDYITTVDTQTEQINVIRNCSKSAGNLIDFPEVGNILGDKKFKEFDSKSLVSFKEYNVSEGVTSFQDREDDTLLNKSSVPPSYLFDQGHSLNECILHREVDSTTDGVNPVHLSLYSGMNHSYENPSTINNVRVKEQDRSNDELESSHLFDSSSLKTLMEPSKQDDVTMSQYISSEILPPSKTTEVSPSRVHISNGLEERENTEIISKTVSTWKSHSSLRNLLVEATLESKQKALDLSNHPSPPVNEDQAFQKSEVLSRSVSSGSTRELKKVNSSRKSVDKEWDSPARLPENVKKEKKKGKGWVPILCCSSLTYNH